MAESNNTGPAPVFVDPFLDSEAFTTELGAELRLQTLTFKNKNGTSLYGRYWKPQGELKALVCVVHGFGEYLISYHEVSMALAKQGCLVFGHDHSGHGRSGGKRATAKCIGNLALDVIDHVKKMRSHYPSAPVFLVGHSMGGMITLLAVEQEPQLFKGIFLVGPFISMNQTVPLPILKVLVGMVCRISSSLAVGSLSLDYVTSDEINRKKIKNDPVWWNGPLKAQMAVAFINGINRLASIMGNFNIPMLIIHGENDMISDPEGSKRLHSSSKATDKGIKFYPKARHHLYLETKDIREMAVKDTVEWIMKRV